MISVIMLTYNRREYVKNMIEDILKQTYKDFEFVIVDNGSTDGTGEIVEEYGKKDLRIKVFHIPAGTVGYGRNFGLSVATSEYIAFVDDDDRVDNDFLEFLVNLQSTDCADIAMCGTDELINGQVVPQCVFNDRYVLSGKEAVIELLNRKRIRAGMPTKLFRKEILLRFPFEEKVKAEDVHTIYKYLADAKKVVIHGIPKYHIVRHGENNSMFTSDYSKLTPEFLREYLNMYRERTEYLCKLYPEETEFFYYTVWSFELSMCHKINENNLNDCKQLLNEMKKEISESKDIILDSRYLKQFEKEWLEQLYD